MGRREPAVSFEKMSCESTTNCLGKRVSFYLEVRETPHMPWHKRIIRRRLLRPTKSLLALAPLYPSLSYILRSCGNTKPNKPNRFKEPNARAQCALSLSLSLSLSFSLSLSILLSLAVMPFLKAPACFQ